MQIDEQPAQVLTGAITQPTGVVMAEPAATETQQVVAPEESKAPADAP